MRDGKVIMGLVNYYGGGVCFLWFISALREEGKIVVNETVR